MFDGKQIGSGTIGVAKLSATGSPGATTVLYGDNTWKVPAANPWTEDGANNLFSNTYAPTLLNTVATTERNFVLGNDIGGFLNILDGIADSFVWGGENYLINEFDFVGIQLTNTVVMGGYNTITMPIYTAGGGGMDGIHILTQNAKIKAEKGSVFFSGMFSGSNNSLYSANYSVLLGGNLNKIGVGNPTPNVASIDYSAIIGGHDNFIYTTAGDRGNIVLLGVYGVDADQSYEHTTVMARARFGRGIGGASTALPTSIASATGTLFYDVATGEVINGPLMYKDVVALSDGAAIAMSLDNTIFGVETLTTTNATITLTLSNVVAGANHVLSVQKNIAGDVTMTLAGTSLVFYGYDSEDLNTTPVLVLSGASGDIFDISFLARTALELGVAVGKAGN
jgi:hypothetical protein